MTPMPGKPGKVPSVPQATRKSACLASEAAGAQNQPDRVAAMSVPSGSNLEMV